MFGIHDNKKLRKKTFRPMSYPYQETSFQLPERIVTKGGTEVLKVDLTRIENILTELRNNADKQIRNLSPQLQKQYQEIVSYVDALFDTEYFTVFSDLIKKKFSDLKNVQPGTIGAYFGGCLINPTVSDIPPSCTPICAGSIPPPKSEIEQGKWAFCETNVIWGFYDGSKFNLTSLNSVPNSNKALLFVNFNSPNNFVGLSEEEKNQLSSLNIQEVEIIGYSPDGKNYTRMTTGFVPVSDVKSRISVVPSSLNTSLNNNPSSHNSSSMNVALLLLLLFVVLVLIFLIWKAWIQ